MVVAMLLVGNRAAQAQGGPLLFTVNNTGDGIDQTPGDGTCATIAGTCTLRAAIQESNVYTGIDTIGFAIPGGGPFVITVGSSLPAITQQVTIDATTQPGYAGTPLIQLSGSGITGGTEIGFYVTSTAPSTVIRGFSIVNFLSNAPDGDGILVEGAACVISANYVGLTAAGTAAPNFNGIRVNNVANTQIGDGTPAGRNIISSNSNGILITGTSATGTLVRHNYIGTNPAGNADLGNAGTGITITSGAASNVIGSTAGIGNVISGNGSNGITVDGGSSANTIASNIIGLDATGSVDLGNRGNGLSISSAANTVVRDPAGIWTG